MEREYANPNPVSALRNFVERFLATPRDTPALVASCRALSIDAEAEGLDKIEAIVRIGRTSEASLALLKSCGATEDLYMAPVQSLVDRILDFVCVHMNSGQVNDSISASALVQSLKFGEDFIQRSMSNTDLDYLRVSELRETLRECLNSVRDDELLPAEIADPLSRGLAEIIDMLGDFILLNRGDVVAAAERCVGVVMLRYEIVQKQSPETVSRLSRVIATLADLAQVFDSMTSNPLIVAGALMVASNAGLLG